MALSSKQLVDLFATPSTHGAYEGMIAALRLSAGHSNAEARLLDQLEAAVPPRPSLASYDDPTRFHPAELPEVARKALEPADLVWLQRVSSDPAQVSYEDAKTLARLAAETTLGSPDGRLVRSVYEPVRRLHATRAAEVAAQNLRNTRSPIIPSEPGAVTVVADAILRERPQVTADEAQGTARDAVAAARARGAAELAQRVREAEDRAYAERTGSAA